MNDDIDQIDSASSFANTFSENAQLLSCKIIPNIVMYFSESLTLSFTRI